MTAVLSNILKSSCLEINLSSSLNNADGMKAYILMKDKLESMWKEAVCSQSENILKIFQGKLRATNPVRIAGVPAKFRTRHLPHKSVVR